MDIRTKQKELNRPSKKSNARPRSLEGKRILVTGASGQLGSEFCQALGTAGAFVIVSDVDDKRGHRQVKNLREKGIGAAWIRLDVGNPDSVRRAFRKIRRIVPKLDVLVNAAAIAVFTPFEKRTLQDFMEVLKINLGGAFLCTQAALPLLKGNKNGSGIINIASIYGIVSSDPGIYTDCNRMNSEVYSASKAGLIMMTRHLAVHLAPFKIRVNALSPGGVFRGHGKDFVKRYSKRTPLGRMANASEISDALIYLASDGASYLTGHNLIVDGGLTAW